MYVAVTSYAVVSTGSGTMTVAICFNKAALKPPKIPDLEGARFPSACCLLLLFPCIAYSSVSNGFTVCHHLILSEVQQEATI
jgi:hypothetical protein